MNTVARRARRAGTARLLLAVYAKGGLTVPEFWTWQRLDALPDWTLLDHRDRALLQRVCGALMLAPLLRLCIDGERIGRARSALGSIPYESVIDSAPRTVDIERVPAALASLEHWLISACRNDIDAALLVVGASVLCAGIVDPLLRDELSRTLVIDLDESAACLPVSWSSLPPTVAVEVLRQATLCVETSNAVVRGECMASESTPEQIALDNCVASESAPDQAVTS